MVRAAQYLLISIVLTFPSASVAQSKKQILTRLQTSLTAEKYFKPLDSGLPNVIFYCVCGPYETCDAQSQEISRQLGYERPSYDFVRGAAKPRQKILFFRSGEIVDVEIPYPQFRIADENESFCSANMDMKIPRSR